MSTIATMHLHRLQELLRAESEVGAARLSKVLKVSMPTVYRRIKALEEHGAVIAVLKEPRPRPGPTPRKFTLVKAAKLPPFLFADST